MLNALPATDNDRASSHHAIDQHGVLHVQLRTAVPFDPVD